MPSCVCVNVRCGCAVYSVRPFGECVSYGSSDAASAGWGVVELRYESSLLAVCGSGLSSALSPRAVLLLDARSLHVLSELSFSSGVLDVRLSGERLVCVVGDRAHVFDLRSLERLYALPAAANSPGACAVVPFEQPPSASSAAFVAVPSHASRGEVSVYSYDGQLLAAVRAHDSPIRLLALSSDGRLLATCSLTGTLIRVFSLPDGLKRLTVRRGTLSAHINCLHFNSRATRLCVASRDSTTVHVFSIPQHALAARSTISPGDRAGQSAQWSGASLLRQSVASLTALTPLSGRLEDLVEPSRSDALITLKSDNEPLALSFSAASSHDAADELLHVVTRAGALLTYGLSTISSSTRSATGSQSQESWHLEHRLLSVQILQPRGAVSTKSFTADSRTDIQSYQ